MLGSAAGAEDILEETWLRWVKVDVGRCATSARTWSGSRPAVAQPAAHNEAPQGGVCRLLAARAAGHRAGCGRAGDVELAESVSMALMLVLETLLPIERAVFALREAFDVSHDEIAAAVDKSPAAVRQIPHRARRHVDARRPHRVVSPSEARADLESFQRGSKPGTSRAFLTYPPVRSSLWPTAAESSRPRCGRSRVPRRLPASPSVVSAESKARSPLSVNGSSAMVIRLDGEVGGVMVIPVEGCPYHRSSLCQQPGEAEPRRIRDAATLR